MAKHEIVAGTTEGLFRLGGETLVQVEGLAGRAITALAGEDRRLWALIDGRSVWCSIDRGPWSEVTRLDHADATCLSPTALGLLVGTERAHLLRLEGDTLMPLE
jgi:hypothetical protein